MRLSLLATETAFMKKEFTNLSVTVPVVAKAREIVAKMPFKTSVAQLAEALLKEAFEAIENKALPSGTLPTIARLRASIHGPTTAANIVDAAVTKATASPSIPLSELDAAITRILHEKGIGEDIAARVAEQPGTYKTKRKA